MTEPANLHVSVKPLAAAESISERALSLGRNRNYLLLSAALFLSNFGSVMLLMSLSLKAFVDTGSSLLSGAVYGSQWLVPLVFLPTVGWLANRFAVRKLLGTAQTLSIGITLLVSLCYPTHLVAFFCLMAVRGLLENVSKSGASVALKLYMPTALLEKASSYYDTNRYVSSAVASLVGMLLLGKMSIAQVALISSLSFLAATVCYACLPYIGAVDARQPRPSLAYWGETLAILRRKPELRRSFINLSLMTGVFQGFFYIARSTLPIGQLGLSIGTAAFIQVLISLTFTGGAMFVARYLLDGSPLNRVLSPLLQVLLGAAFMMGCVMTRQPFASIGSFLACLFWFEVYYTRVNNYVMLASSPAEISYISAARYGSLTFSMLVVVVAGGALADRIGFVRMTEVLSVGVSVGYLVLNVRGGRGRSRRPN